MKFAAKKEKRVLSSLFGVSSDSEGDDSSDSCSSDSEDARESLGADCNDTFSDGEVSVSLKQYKERGIAHQLWPAAVNLCKYFHTNRDLLQSNDGRHWRPILELGAGVGLCGIYLSKLGAENVVVTDLAEALPTLNENITLNSCSDRVQATELCWGDSNHLDAALARLHCKQRLCENDSEKDCHGIVGLETLCPLIIAADCVYWECLFQPFYETVNALAQLGCNVVISHVKRWKKDEKFFAMCRKTMSVTVLSEEKTVVWDEQTQEQRRKIERIYLLAKRETVIDS